MAEQNDLYIYGAIRAMTGEGKAAYAEQVYDEQAGRFQSDMNAEFREDISEMMSEVFPVEVAVVSSNAGTREIGTSITPVIEISITRKGSDVAASSEVSVSPDDGSLSQDKKTYTGASISSGSKTYQIVVAQGGQTKSAPNQVFSFTNYRYKGVLSSKPNTSNIVATIRALPKELSTVSTLGETKLEAGEYYLFAVKGNHTLIVKNARTGGTIDIPSSDKGTATVPQENGVGSNAYSWIIVPAPSTWYFQITNS